MTELAFGAARAEDAGAVRTITERAYAGWTAFLGYPPQPVADDPAPRIARGEVALTIENGRIFNLIVVTVGETGDLISSVAVDPDRAGRGVGPRLMA